MRPILRLAAAVLAGTMLASGLLPAGGHAETAPTPTPMPPMPRPPVDAANTPAAREYTEAMERMHQAMNAPSTGDPDRDFVSLMIPHHQGAVEMARTELHYGNDPQMRALARQIIADQRREIAQMQRWQTRHGEKHAE